MSISALAINNTTPTKAAALKKTPALPHESRAESYVENDELLAAALDCFVLRMAAEMKNN
jgi:hypothetical protein